MIGLVRPLLLFLIITAPKAFAAGCGEGFELTPAALDFAREAKDAARTSPGSAIPKVGSLLVHYLTQQNGSLPETERALRWVEAPVYLLAIHKDRLVRGASTHLPRILDFKRHFPRDYVTHPFIGGRDEASAQRLKFGIASEEENLMNLDVSGFFEPAVVTEKLRRLVQILNTEVARTQPSVTLNMWVSTQVTEFLKANDDVSAATLEAELRASGSKVYLFAIPRRKLGSAGFVVPIGTRSPSEFDNVLQTSVIEPNQIPHLRSLMGISESINTALLRDVGLYFVMPEGSRPN